VNFLPLQLQEPLSFHDGLLLVSERAPQAMQAACEIEPSADGWPSSNLEDEKVEEICAPRFSYNRNSDSGQLQQPPDKLLFPVL